MPDPTLGQRAYEAYVQHFQAYPAHPKSTVFPGPWMFLAPLQQACWEAAAQAVLVETLAHWQAREAEALGSVRAALTLAVRYGQIDGAHHKAWVIDQMCRTLLGSEDAYRQFVAEACAGDEGPRTYDWNEGIAP